MASEGIPGRSSTTKGPIVTKPSESRYLEDTMAVEERRCGKAIEVHRGQFRYLR